jgi:nucleoid DNA-binding protein
MNSKVTKEDLVKATAQLTGQTMKSVLQAVDTFLDEIGNNLEQGSSIELRNFGKLEKRKTEPRTCFINKEQTVVPARWRISFKASKNLIKEWKIEDNPSKPGNSGNT